MKITNEKEFLESEEYKKTYSYQVNELKLALIELKDVIINLLLEHKYALALLWLFIYLTIVLVTGRW